MIDYIDSSLPKIHPAQCCDKLSPLAQDFWSFSSADFVEGAAAVKASVSLAESPFVSYEKHLRQSLRELLAARIEEAKDGCFPGAASGSQWYCLLWKFNVSHFHGNLR